MALIAITLSLDQRRLAVSLRMGECGRATLHPGDCVEFYPPPAGPCAQINRRKQNEWLLSRPNM